MTVSNPPLRGLRLFGAMCCLVLVAACASAPQEAASPPVEQFVDGYGLIEDDGYRLPGVPNEYLAEPNRRAIVTYTGDQPAGTIEIDPFSKFLFYVQDDGTALRYPIAVGREGRSLRGTVVIKRKEHWPGWTPTANMLRTEPEVYGDFAKGIPGGLKSPLGARALYLYRGSRDTHYRIHGTNDLPSIGNSGSAGCIRMFNQDIIDLFERVELGTKVVIRNKEDAIRLEGEEVANRGVELEPKTVDPALIYNDEEIVEEEIAAVE